MRFKKGVGLYPVSNHSAILLVLILVLVQIIGMFTFQFSLTDRPLGDSIAYQIFIEDFLRGKLNFTLGGFQGSSIPGILLHYFFPTSQSFVLTQLFFTLISIPLFFLVSKLMFKSNSLALVAVLFYTLMPELIFSGLNGYPQGVFHFMTILTLFLLLNRSRLTFLFFGWSLIAKPFSLALLPFFICKKQVKHFILGCLMGGIYLLIQYFSLGKIMIGVHPNIEAIKVFRADRILYNLASAPPLLLSIHNYLPFSSMTTLGDRVQTSPLVITAALISVLYLKNLFPGKKLFVSLVWLAILSFLLPASLSYLDTNYLQTFLIACIWLSLPFFSTYPLLLPITVATLAYQYVYTFLSLRDFFVVRDIYLFFVIPVVGWLISIYLAQEGVKKLFLKTSLYQAWKVRRLQIRLRL